MKKFNYTIRDTNTGKVYGPVYFYKTADLIADKIDDKYGEVVAKIELYCKGKSIEIKRNLTHENCVL